MKLCDLDELKKRYALLMWKEHNPYDAVKVCDVVNQTLDFIDNAPTVERPQGKWISNGGYGFINRGKHCSYCNYNVEFSTNFCPNCGSDMRKG